MHTGDSIMCLCVRKKGGLWLRPCICQPCCRLQCVTVKREPGPQGHPTGIKTALSVGCVSQWAAEPWGAALLITARVGCQCRHMMHSAITVEGGGGQNTKQDRCNPLQQICKTPQLRLLGLSVSIGLFRFTQLVNARSGSHGGEGRIYCNLLITRKHNLKPKEHQYN